MIKEIICPECKRKNSSKDHICKNCEAELLLNKRYKLVKVLGKNVGITYLAYDLKTKKGVVIKELFFKRLNRWKTEELFQKEVELLTRLNHSSIPKIIENFTNGVGRDQKTYLITEYFKGITLEKAQEKREFTIKEIFKIVINIAKILEYLHTFNPPIVHRDLKPSNLLIGKEDNISLIDFGSVKDIVNPNNGAEIVGTFGYMAPEQFSGHSSKKSDYYSLGVIALVLFTNIEPEEMIEDAYDMDKENQFVWKKYLKTENRKFKLLLEKLLEEHEAKRISSLIEIENIIYDKKRGEKVVRKKIKGKKIIDDRFKLVKKIENEGLVDKYLAKDLKNDEKIVLVNRLIINNSDLNRELVDYFDKESIKLKKIKNRAIPRYIKISKYQENDKTIFYSVQKRGSGVSINKFLEKNNNIVNKDFAIIALQSLRALKYLKSISVVHGNINSDNLLIKKDYFISLINFGIIEKLAKMIDKYNNNSIYNDHDFSEYDTKTDQYALGMSFINLVTTKDLSVLPISKKRVRFSAYCNISGYMIDLIEIMTDSKREKRFSDLDIIISQLETMYITGYYANDQIFLGIKSTKDIFDTNEKNVESDMADLEDIDFLSDIPLPNIKKDHYNSREENNFAIYVFVIIIAIVAGFFIIKKALPELDKQAKQQRFKKERSRDKTIENRRKAAELHEKIRKMNERFKNNGK